MKSSSALPRTKCLVAFALSLSLVGVGGCSKAKSEHQESRVVTAYKLIDANRADEAVVILEDVLRQEPGNNDARVALASAYATMANLQLFRFYDLVFGLASKPSENKKQAVESATQSPGGELDKKVAKVALGIAQVLNILFVLENIPNVDAKQAKYLEQSIAILNGLEGPERGNALFRATLEVVYLKYLMINHTVPSMFTVKQESCRFSLDGATAAIKSTTKEVRKIVEDLALSFPNQKGQLVDLYNQIAEVSRALTGVTIVSSLANDLLDKLIREHLVNARAGEILSCSR